MSFTELFLMSVGFMVVVPWLLTGVLWFLIFMVLEN